MNDMGFSGMREPLYGWIAPALTVGEKSLREEAGDPLKDLKSDLDKSGKTPKDILNRRNLSIDRCQLVRLSIVDVQLRTSEHRSCRYVR
mgnify:CR=1 FL=1